ncbi:paired amphipathic helix protein Sin3-like 4 isoform X2 [Physcomitrium patens]|uniref:Histone deacetylase interacting domain-containing protein n=1 Tax=Physcomitrium patens TaxID=3218 RepID=A0A7I4CK12_PHYPA|nr:paired amphipathic helix protein Sin3-like 3 isoform X2 [Physcomitrium patens]|eukprot:XP_024363995.1 paired amphipathic helix protein Sin3-like 3 isoform X2 [Physcomitrella patens]
MKKRERGDDENGLPQGKRTAGPQVGEASEAVTNNNLAANGQRLTTDDALAYLKAVKEKFKDDKAKYDEFLEVMKDFKVQKVDTAGVISRVKQLFKGHPQLILGFNTFLPKGYEITLPEEEKPAVEFDQAINYVNKIKARFAANESVYKQFLEILNYYRKGNKSINEVYQEVARLFANHPDLLEEFTYFLPGTSGPSMANGHSNVKPMQHNARQRDEKGFASSAKPSNDRLVILKKEKSSSVPGERSREREPERRPERPRKVGDKAERKETWDRKDRVDREEGSRDKEKEFVEQKPAKRASARTASDAIRRQSQAGEVGEGFSGPVPQASTDDKKSVKGVIGVQYPFFDKVKARLRSRDTYQEFLKCLNIFSQEIISRDELQSLVGDILGKHADLMEGFTEFLTHCENVEGYLAGVFSGRKLGEIAEGAPVKDVKTERDGDRERNREKEKERERQRDTKERDRDVKPSQAAKEGGHKVVSNKDKYINKPISELDLSNCDRCTPSYRLLPKHYPRPVSNHRTALGNSVLNDSWVSVTSGSEDYSFKHMRKNQYEESLFRCEDDRFELDMLLEGTAVTAKLVGDYITKQEEQNGKAEALPPVDEFLSAINLRCIERIYGDHGLDMLEAVRKNTSRAMPVIHSRLVQKEEEWTRCREEMNKVWSEVYAKNCYKALDHRSFYFRSQDKKALSTKGLLAEIKEVSEKRRREDDTMLAMIAGNRKPLLPDLRYEFSDPSIHDDMYQIIKYSSEEISSLPDHTEKTMRMWKMFVEPVLGVSSRSQRVEDVEEGVKEKALESEGGDGIGGESAGSEGNGRSSPEDGGMSSEREGTTSRGAEVVGVEGSEGRVMAGTTNGAASGGERNVGGNSVVENARVEADDRGSDGAREGVAVEGGEGTAARTEGSGWLHGGGNGAKQSGGAAGRGEVGVRANAGLGENRGSRSVADGGGLLMDSNGSGGGEAVDREEGELSPCSEQEERKKPKYSPRRGGEENGAVKLFGGEEDAEGVGLREMEHEQDDEGEESAQKSSSGSDTPSEVGEEVSASEQSGDEHSEHEEEEEEEEQEGKAESEGEAEGMTDVDDGDGDGNSSLADSEHSYVHCKPLAAYPGFGAGLAGVSQLKKDGRIFYGNDTFYVLFRLYQTLYERLLSAKVNAELASKKKSGDGGDPPNLYSRFMQVLYGLLDGSVDNSKFEDECRAIIGTQSYILFTLDKLIFKLVKQLQAAATDDVMHKLLALNAYENGREAVDAVYYADACVVLHDESIYRFEQRSNPSELLIQLMEHLEVPGNSLESSFQKYLDRFLTSVPSSKRGQVFCARNLKRMRVEEDADYGEDVNILNGLEIKMSCRTSKVSYVLDTEDVFWRSVPGGKRRKATVESKRRGQFHKWMQETEVHK